MLGVEGALVELGEEPDAGEGGIVGFGGGHVVFVYLQLYGTQADL
jgi:hypothetical protein